jgi:cation:H+ antiporter
MLLSFVMVAAGLVLLGFGGEFLVRGALVIARKLGVSPLLAGVVVVGFGTSAPELLVSVIAALSGKPDIAIGNVVGSNIANLFLILGISGLLTPMACSDRAVRRDAWVCVLSGFLLLGLGWYGIVSRPAGVMMVLFLVLYLLVSTRADRNLEKEKTGAEDVKTYDNWPLWLAAIVSGISVVMLAIGADLLVEGAISIARTLGVSDAVIGLTLVAVGTSLPELAATVVAAARRQADVIIGSIFGSTLFNTFNILGLTALVAPLPISERMASLDIPVSIVAMVIVAVVVQLSQHITVRHGVVLVSMYALYIGWLFT